MGLNAMQRRAIDLFQRGQNVFLCGEAGTGKSFTTKEVIKLATRRAGPNELAITGSTGVAAVAIGGVTLHSWAGLGLAEEPVDKLLIKAIKWPHAWRQTSILIIDEVSMLSCELLSKLECIARHVRNNNRPFGGIQLFMVGDFAQLAPVVRGTKNIYAFQADCWLGCMGNFVELTEIYRQSDAEFISILRHARDGSMPQDAIDILNSRISKDPPPRNGVVPTKLYCKKIDVYEQNYRELVKLPGESVIYEARDYSDGTVNGEKALKTLCQHLSAPAKLELRVGAQIMITANLSPTIVNGTRGVVTGCNETSVDVDFVDGDSGTIEVYKWERKDGKLVVASRKQIPIMLAWALTIHKSQGSTLDFLVVDLNGAFACGQAYVALSRATTLDALHLAPFTPDAFIASPVVIEFMGRMRTMNMAQLQTPPLSLKTNMPVLGLSKSVPVPEVAPMRNLTLDEFWALSKPFNHLKRQRE